MTGGYRRFALSVALGSAILLATIPVARHVEAGGETDKAAGDFWQSFLPQAKAAGLPTQFLLSIPHDFLILEFDDLHAFAAEYHPEEHRLVLNQALSFNAAGGVLKPISQLSPREVGTVYHELFHAYMDFAASLDAHPGADERISRLITFARERQACRYRQVSITPILQRKTRTEVRHLTDRESWEALNETWAVFVGWAVWTKLELQRGRGGMAGPSARLQAEWLKRLRKADREGDLIGYYEPEQEAERAITRKRFLAPSHRITPAEVHKLLTEVLEFSIEDADKAVGVMEPNRPPMPGSPPCP
ncbi:hypothetical protein [Candidatus Nitrospira bockiana]